MGVEKLLTDKDNERFTMFPVQHTDLWDMYKKSVASFWTVEEVDLAEDVKQWKGLAEDKKKLTDDEKYFVENVLAFFAASDGIVMENLTARFLNDIQISEARAFYGFQIAIENIHGEMYSVLIDSLVEDAARKKELFESLQRIEWIRQKGEWAMRWIQSSRSFAERLVAFACVEGIFFSASFCAVFWLKKRGLMPGLTFSNELISRDEGLHRDFACMLYKKLDSPLEKATVYKIVRQAVAIEHEFVRNSLKVAVIGMNADAMCAYVEFVANHLLSELGLEPAFLDFSGRPTPNPFDWMELISLQGKTNFFEKRVGEYQKAGVCNAAEMNHKFSLIEDF